MPKFFFDIVEDGVTIPDEDGLDLTDVDQAMVEAFATLPDLARETGSGSAPLTIRSRVRNEIGDVMFEATLRLRVRQFRFNAAGDAQT